METRSLVEYIALKIATVGRNAAFIEPVMELLNLRGYLGDLCCSCEGGFLCKSL